MKLLVASAMALLLVAAAHSQERTVTVQLLAINDLHGNLEPPTGHDGLVNGAPAGGTEYLATHLRMAEERNPNSIVIGAGDLMGASPLLSAAFHDEPTIEALDAMHMSVTSIGNHEMDHGPAELDRRLHGGCIKTAGCKPEQPAKYQYLAGNVIEDAKPGHTLYPAVVVRTVGGVKIGFIGETLEGSPAVISSQAIQGLRFEEESAVANAAAAGLERQGVHAIVLLVHQGGFQHDDNAPLNINGCANFTGEIKRIAERLSPSIKLVISGHTHTFYNCEIAGHTVTSAGAYGRLFTEVNLTIDRRTDEITGLTAKNEVVTRDVPRDPAQAAIIARYKPLAAKMADAVVGSISGSMTHKANEIGESSMGDVIADAELAATSAPQSGEARIAFMNQGGIRADLVLPASSSGPHDVTYGDLYAVQPFSNQLIVVSMTGDLLRKLLEQQFAPRASDELLQISSSFNYRFRRNAPPGQHIVEGSMLLDGKPIAATDTLRIAVSDFVAGGSGLPAFREATRVAVGPVDLEALVAYFKTHSPVAPGPQNRIARLE